MVEEEEKNEWGPKGQPSASEQLKISGYTEETEYPEPNWEEKIQNELSKPKNEQLNSGIAANDPLVDSLLIGAPLLAKPALMKGLMIGGGNLIKAHPLKALDVGFTALGAIDAVKNPQDLVTETMAMKTDTMFSGPMGSLNKYNVRGKVIAGKYLSEKLDDWLINPLYGLINNGKQNRLALEGVGNLDNAKPLQSISSTPSGGGGTQFAHSVYPRSNAGLLKQLKQQGVLDEAEEILKNLDAFKNTEGKIQKYARWNPHRPTTGFKGTRTVKYINSSGVPSEVAFRWSATNKTYVPYDLVRRQNTILKRMRWNVNRSPTAKKYADKVYKKAKSDNALFIKLLKELRKNDPQKYFDIMGDTRKYATNKGFIYVEHIHPQNSPWWKYMTKDKFKPRDTKNLMIAKEEFGKLKTSIENEIYNNKNFKFPDGKRLLLDYDKTESKFILKQLQDNGRLKWVGDISAITNPRDWRKALDAALRGHVIEPGKLGEIQQVIQADTDIPKLVDAIDDITGYKDPRYDR